MEKCARALLIALLFCCPFAATAGSVGTDVLFSNGVNAFKSGDYARALAYFRQAQAAGLDQPALHYNLGASLYKLGRYREAQTAFRGAARAAEWAALAYYNIGLSAHKVGDEAVARDSFRHALRSADDDKLRALAFAMLDRLGAAPRWRSELVLNAGYDSNVTLAADSDTLRASEESDTFLELAASADRRVGKAGDGTRLNAAFSSLRYTDIHDFDLTGVSLGAATLVAVGERQATVGGDFEYLWLDGIGFQRILTLRAAHLAGSPAGGVQVRFSYGTSRVDEADSRFDYLAGWRHLIAVSAVQSRSKGWLRYGAALEVNRREDLKTDGEFFSHSPAQLTLSLARSWPLGDGWRVEPSVAWRASRYADPDRRVDGTDMTREDRHSELAVRLTRPLSEGWQLAGDYRYVSNHSNFPEFEYARYVATVGVMGRF